VLAPPGSLVQIWGDSQSAISATQHMHCKAVFCQVAALHVAAFRHGVGLSLVWCPRDSEDLQAADALSKPSDPADWLLSRQIATTAVSKHAPQYAHLWPPQLDLFASSRAHQCDSYVASAWDGSCVAVNAMSLNWGRVELVRGRRGDRVAVHNHPVCCAFPPFGLLVQTLHKLYLDGAVAWVICPLHLTSLQQFLLNELRPVCAFDLQAPSHVLMSPTRAVPPEVVGQGWRTRLQMCLVGVAAWRSGTALQMAANI
jgi:hypothetical protein